MRVTRPAVTIAACAALASTMINVGTSGMRNM